MPDPPGLVVKNGTKRFAVLGNPGPSSSTRISTQSSCSVQPSATAPPVSSAASTALRVTLMSSCSS